MRPLKRLSLLLGLLLVSLPYTSQALEVPQGILSLKPRPAPHLRLADLDGQITDLAHLRGKWVFVHFWASWCGPCRRELPRLQSLPKHLDPHRFTMLLVNTAEDEDTVFSFLASVAPDLHTVLDKNGLITDAWKPRGLPSTYLVDPKGRIRYLALGGRAWDTPTYLNFLQGLVEGR